MENESKKFWESRGYVYAKKTDLIVKPLWWQKRGLMYTASGYGARIPMEYMIKDNGKMKRVYCAIFSNVGSLYIFRKGAKISVHIDD